GIRPAVRQGRGEGRAVQGARDPGAPGGARELRESRGGSQGALLLGAGEVHPAAQAERKPGAEVPGGALSQDKLPAHEPDRGPDRDRARDPRAPRRAGDQLRPRRLHQLRLLRDHPHRAGAGTQRHPAAVPRSMAGEYRLRGAGIGAAPTRPPGVVAPDRSRGPDELAPAQVEGPATQGTFMCPGTAASAAIVTKMATAEAAMILVPLEPRVEWISSPRISAAGTPVH